MREGSVYLKATFLRVAFYPDLFEVVAADGLGTKMQSVFESKQFGEDCGLVYERVNSSADADQKRIFPSIFAWGSLEAIFPVLQGEIIQVLMVLL